MTCKKCGSELAYMDGTVERCFCGLWIETQPEIDDTEALKQYCRQLNKSEAYHSLKYLSAEERKQRTKDKQREYHYKHREHILKVKKQYRERIKAQKQQAAA